MEKLDNMRHLTFLAQCCRFTFTTPFVGPTAWKLAHSMEVKNKRLLTLLCSKAYYKHLALHQRM